MYKILFVLLSISIMFFSCKEDPFFSENNNDENSTQASQDHLLSENIMNDIERIVENGLESNGLAKSSCVNYKSIAAISANPDTLIIDYGDINCLDEYGKLRRGKVIVIYTAPYRDSLANITTSFDHYYVNNNWVQGSKKITNLGRDLQGNMVFHIETDLNITTSKGRIDWQTDRTRIWTAGINTTLYPFDNEYKIIGNSSGTGLNNRSFTATITDTLAINLGCLQDNITYNKRCFITSGKVEITPDNLSTREINYGDGGCNCDFTVTVNGTPYLIVVP